MVEPPDGKKDDPEAAEPAVRSRWTPKPEQILILESIFNSGMVNPPKEETARIRRLLEKFGAVGDANVFYWFQNRRSRSRRRQRQLQAGLAAAVGSSQDQLVFSSSSSPSCSSLVSSASSANDTFASSTSGFFPYAPSSSSSSSLPSSSSSSSYCYVGDERGDDLFSISSHMGFPQRRDQDMNPFECSSHAAPQLQYQPSGTITVFINGILSEVPRGSFNMRSMFGYNVMLVHSSGEFVPVDEYGFLMQSLEMGESYFLVCSST